jgi:hypothetical protein
MELAYFTFTNGRKHLRAKQEQFERLLAEIDIPEFGEEERLAYRGYGAGIGHKTRRIRIATSITCKRDIWNAIGAHGWNIAGNEGITRYRFLRTALADSTTPHPREAALAAAKRFDTRPKKWDVYRLLGGTFDTMTAVMVVIDEYFGVKTREVARGHQAKELQLEDLVARFPILKDLEGTCLDAEFGGGAGPQPKMLGRVDLFASRELATVCGLTLLTCHERFSERGSERAVVLLEYLDRAATDGAGGGTFDFLDPMRAVVIDDRLKLSHDQRYRLQSTYGVLRSALLEWYDELPASRRGTFTRYIPPPLPAEFSDASMENFERLTEERDQRRASTAQPITLQRDEILSATELRFKQLDRLTDKVVAEMKRVRALLDSGKQVEFPVPVSDKYHAVRSGLEGLGNGAQTIRLQIDTVARLHFECASAEEAAGLALGERLAWHYLSAERRQLLRPRGDGEEPHPDGQKWKPGFESDLKVLYVGTHAVEPGGECEEPFWVELFRSRFFDPGTDMDPEERERRKALVALVGADPQAVPLPGLLVDSSRTGKALTKLHRKLGSRDRVLISIEEFRHAMAIGRVVLRAELMRGMRIGESSQGRTDDDAWSWRKFDGKFYMYMTAIPKQGRGRYRRMVLDPVTVSAYERVRVIAVGRWFGEAGDIPIRAFHDADRDDVPAGRYLLGNAVKACGHMDLNFYLRVLTLGIVSSTSHSYKSGFAGMLKSGNARDHVLNAACNHAAGSPVSDKYARFASEHMVDAFIEEQQRASEKRQLDWRLLEAAGL